MKIKNKFLQLTAASILCLSAFSAQVQAQTEPLLGQISMFAGNFAPRGWAFCEGQLLPINQHQALFSILGTYYGGDGRTTFGLPDLRGRSPIHVGTGPGLSNHTLGAKGGVETVILNNNNLPSITLQGTTGQTTEVVTSVGTTTVSLRGGTTDTNIVGAIGKANITTGINSQNLGGSSTPIRTRSPHLAINYIIALEGTFPSRN